MFFFRFPPQIQNVISHYKILGFIPLDKVLHISVGLIVTIVMRKLKFRMRSIFAFLFVLELYKEVNDYFVLNSSSEEQVLDFIATFVYPLLLLIVIQIKKHAKD